MNACNEEGHVRSNWVKMLAWMMVLVLPSSIVMAEAASAMLSVTGDVTVNGTHVARSTAVFPGDKVQTAGNASASMTAEGLSVFLPGNSSLVVGAKQVELGCGGALVTTAKGASAQISDLTVSPARGERAKFEVTQVNGVIQIVAREGAVAVNNGGRTTRLEPGRMFSAPGAGCSVDMSRSGPPTTGGSNHGMALAFGVALAAVTVTAILLTRGEAAPISP